MAKSMKTRKGNDNINYPYTSPDLVIDNNGESQTTKNTNMKTDIANIKADLGTAQLTTTAKNIKGAINEIKSLVNQGSTGGSSTGGESYDDTAIKADIASIKTDLGTVQLTTTVKNIKGAINEVDAQCEDLASRISNVGQPTDAQVSTAVNKYLTDHPISGSIDSVVDTVPDNNLIDKNNLLTSINKGGTTLTGNFTNYIKIEAGKKYVTNLNMTQFYFFNNSKVFQLEQTYAANPQIIPGIDGYMVAKLPASNSDPLILEGTDIGAHKTQHVKLKASLEDNKWYGKKWLLIGDSISTDEAVYAKNGYGKLVSRELGMTVTNISVSGKVMHEAYTWLDSMSTKFDLITVMMGTNNEGYACEIGALNDSYYTGGTYNSNKSFYAQVQLLIEKLKNKYPKSVIMFLTPIKRTGVGEDASLNDSNGYHKRLYTTEKYRDVIIDCCKYYSIPYVDLYNTIDPRIEADRNLYFVNNDGTHPNDLGHALFLAPVIKDAIVKQCPYYFNEW